MARLDAPLWIFGYGSLVWRPSFSFDVAVPARLHGWRRRFWQGSTDHRGVPGAPGRVVTVFREPGAECWGRVYRVTRGCEAEVLARLDHREQGGYGRFEVDVEFSAQPTSPSSAPDAGAADGLEGGTTASMYSATVDNHNYLGPAPLGEIARQVCTSRGPSGPNVEYVFELADALRAMGARDEHVFALEECVRREISQ